MLLGTLLFCLIPEQLLQIFNADNALLEIGVPALRIISICFPSAALSIVFSTLFQAVGEGRYSLYISAFRQLLFLLPSAYLLSKISLFFVWFAFPISEFIALLFTFFLYSRLKKNAFNDLK